MASAAVHSKAAVILFICCFSLLSPLFVQVLCWALIFCAELGVLLSFAIIPLGMIAGERAGCFAFIVLFIIIITAT